MSNNSVFSGIKNPNPLNLKLPNINSEEFDKVINTRRSVRVFSDDNIETNRTVGKVPQISNFQTKIQLRVVPLFIFVKYDVSAFTGKNFYVKIIKTAFFTLNSVL